MEHPIDRLKALFAEIGSERMELEPVYAPEVRFEDPFHVLEGREALDAYFARLNRNVERCTFTFHDDVRGDGVAFLAWTMDLRLKRPRNHVVLPGATRVRWSDAGVRELLAQQALFDELVGLLQDYDLRIFTGNAFVHGDFHGRGIKDDVYRPDWSEEARGAYTVRFAEVLGRLGKAGVACEGPISLSTSPLSWKGWEDGAARAERGIVEAVLVAAGLWGVERAYGQRVELAFEPEPRQKP